MQRKITGQPDQGIKLLMRGKPMVVSEFSTATIRVGRWQRRTYRH